MVRGVLESISGTVPAVAMVLAVLLEELDREGPAAAIVLVSYSRRVSAAITMVGRQILAMGGAQAVRLLIAGFLSTLSLLSNKATVEYMYVVTTFGVLLGGSWLVFLFASDFNAVPSVVPRRSTNLFCPRSLTTIVQ